MNKFYDSVKETQEVLAYICPDNVTARLYNDVGFCSKLQDSIDGNVCAGLFNDCIDSIQPEHINEMYQKGYELNNSPSDNYVQTQEVFIAEVETTKASFKLDIARKILEFTQLLSPNRENIIFLYVTGDDFTNELGDIKCPYDVEIFKACQQIKTKFDKYRMSIYVNDLTCELSSYWYKMKCVSSDALDVSECFPITSNADLDKLIAFIGNARRIKVDDKLCKDLDVVQIACLAYASLKCSCMFASFESRLAEQYVVAVKDIHRGGSNIRYTLNHYASLANRDMVLLENGVTSYCRVRGSQDSYGVKCIKLKDLDNDLDLAMVRALVSTYDTIVSPEDLFESSVMLSVLYSEYKCDSDKLTEMLRRVQMVAMYRLTDRLISINSIGWFIKDNDIYFCILDAHRGRGTVNICRKDIFTGKLEWVEKDCDMKNLLPLSLFSLNDFSEMKISQAIIDKDRALEKTGYETFESLRYRYGDRVGLDTFGIMCQKGMFVEAMEYTYVADLQNMEDIYRECVSVYGKEFIDKLSIDLGGRFDFSFKLSSLV